MINHFVCNGFQSGWDVLPVKSDLQGIVSHPSFPSCTQSAPLKCDVCGSFQLYCSQKPWWQISSALTVCAVLWNDCRSATVRERMTPGIRRGWSANTAGCHPPLLQGLLSSYISRGSFISPPSPPLPWEIFLSMQHGLSNSHISRNPKGPLFPFTTWEWWH